MTQQLTVIGQEAFDLGTWDWLAVAAVPGRVDAVLFALPEDAGDVDVPAGVAGMTPDAARRVADLLRQAADEAESTP